MKMRTIAMLLAAALAGAFVTFAFLHPEEAKDEEAVAPAAHSRVSVQNGEPAIELDAKTQQTIGLRTATVTASTQTQELQLFGNVVDVQELAAMQSQVAAARAQLQQVEAKAGFDRAELTRLRTLNADNRAVSDKAVQEAAAAVASDQASAASANAGLLAAQTAASQRFGPAISSAMVASAPLYANLIAFRTMLVQISMPPNVAPPPAVSIATNGGAVTARLLSPAPRVDPKLQGASFFYLAPGGSLAAGMNVTARYSGATSVAGVAIPPEAIVSWQGSSWVYLQRDNTHFARRQVGGAFATNVPPGTAVVVTGAQQLLSEEMRSQLGEE